jgi:Zn finger protein HypA/HybF involved in hydrogenase expression
MIISRWIILRMRNFSEKNLCSITFFPWKSCRLWQSGKIWYNHTQQNDNTAHEHSMLDTKLYKHTLRICNSHWFSTTTLVARTRLTVTLYAPSLYCTYKQPHYHAHFKPQDLTSLYCNLCKKKSVTAKKGTTKLSIKDIILLFNFGTTDI